MRPSDLDPAARGGQLLAEHGADRSERFARALAALGVRPGDRVATPEPGAVLPADASWRVIVVGKSSGPLGFAELVEGNEPGFPLASWARTARSGTSAPRARRAHRTSGPRQRSGCACTITTARPRPGGSSTTTTIPGSPHRSSRARWADRCRAGRCGCSRATATNRYLRVRPAESRSTCLPAPWRGSAATTAGWIPGSSARTAAGTSAAKPVTWTTGGDFHFTARDDDVIITAGCKAVESAVVAVPDEVPTPGSFRRRAAEDTEREDPAVRAEATTAVRTRPGHIRPAALTRSSAAVPF